MCVILRVVWNVFHWDNLICLYFRPYTLDFGVGNLTDACMWYHRGPEKTLWPATANIWCLPQLLPSLPSNQLYTLILISVHLTIWTIQNNCLCRAKFNICVSSVNHLFYLEMTYDTIRRWIYTIYHMQTMQFANFNTSKKWHSPYNRRLWSNI